MNNWQIYQFIKNGRGGGEETDPTVPSYVKSISQEDIEKWNNNTSESFVKVETNDSYDIDIADIKEQTPDGEFEIRVKDSGLNHKTLILSQYENLLPTFTNITNGDREDITVELINGNSLKINGTSNEKISVFIKASTNNTFELNKQIEENSFVTYGVLSNGSMSDNDEVYFSYAFDGVGGKSLYFKGEVFLQTSFKVTSNCSSMRMWFNIPAGITFDNYIVTPFVFNGESIESVTDPSYESSVYTIPQELLLGYEWLSTYPNVSNAVYKIETKQYVDKKISEIPTPPPQPIQVDLSYITPEDFGAKGDGVTDDTQALLDCFSTAKASAGRLVVRGFKEYKTSSTISIEGDRLNVVLNRIVYDGNDFAIKIVTRWSDVDIQDVVSNNGGGVLISDENASTSCISNRFQFGFIESKFDCVKFNATYHWNIAYNNIIVPYLKSTESHLININHSCSECDFVGARIDCINGWCIYDSIGTCSFSNFAFEKCKNICYGYGKLIDCRTTEGLNYYEWKGTEGTLFKLNKVGEKSNSYLNDLNTTSTFTGIDVSEIPSFQECLNDVNSKIIEYEGDEQQYYKAFYDIIEYSPNVVQSVTRYSATDNVDEQSLDGKLVIYWNKKAYVPNSEILYSVKETNCVPFESVMNTPTYFRIDTTNTEIHLNDSYCPIGINKFKVEQIDSFKAKVFDSLNNLIFDGTDKEDGLYEFECIVKPLNSTVFEGINAPDTWKETYAKRITNVYTGDNAIWMYHCQTSQGGGATPFFSIFNATVKNGEVTIVGLVDNTYSGNAEIPSSIGDATVTTIGINAFRGTTGLTSIEIPNTVTTIGNSAFRDAYGLVDITIPNGVTVIENDLFNNSFIRRVTLPNSITQIKTGAFNLCRQLEVVVLENEFDSDGLDLSYSNKLTNEIIVDMLNALADRTGQTAYTLKLGSTNLAKLTDEEKTIATNKNWILA